MDVRIPSARRALEAHYGLALETVTDQELARALDDAEREAPGAAPWDAAFVQRLLDCLPIGESSLFRNVELWSWLSRALLPHLLDEALVAQRPLRCLSLGCASGQEPFSLAMVLLGLLRDRGVPSQVAGALVRVRGVDASEARIAAARTGLLNAWSVERANGGWTEGFLRADPLEPGRYVLEPTVLAITELERANLVELAADPAALSGFRLVLCQHVLMYFREAKALEVLRGLVGSALPGTVLIVSPVEAHLLEALPEVDPLEHVGCARVRGRDARRPAAAPCLPTAPAPLTPAVPLPGPAASSLADECVRSAAEHLNAGRVGEALKAARAACAADPRHMMARLLVGQVLLRVDRAQGRRVLEGLSEEVSRMDQRMAVPSARELTVEQLGAAVRLLLEVDP